MVCRKVSHPSKFACKDVVTSQRLRIQTRPWHSSSSKIASGTSSDPSRITSKKMKNATQRHRPPRKLRGHVSNEIIASSSIRADREILESFLISYRSSSTVKTEPTTARRKSKEIVELSSDSEPESESDDLLKVISFNIDGLDHKNRDIRTKHICSIVKK